MSLVEEHLSILFLNVHGGLDCYVTLVNDLIKAVMFIDIEMAWDFNFGKHIKVISDLNFFSWDFSKFFVGKSHVHSVVNIAPLWVGSSLLAVLTVSVHKVRGLLEIIEHEFFLKVTVALIKDVD